MRRIIWRASWPKSLADMAAYVPPEGSIPTLAVPDLTSVRSAHLIGIGGAGMSGIARLLMARGVSVTGSDLKDSRGLEALRLEGAAVSVGHRADGIGRPDVVVISTAIPEVNAELSVARRTGIPILARAQALAALAVGKRTFAVSGTHGKTTTTSMLAVIMERAGLDPTFVIGGDLNEIGSGARHGDGEAFIAEADESDGSFLLLLPDVAVVTNVEEDHLDFYRDADEIEAAFASFFERSDAIVTCGDDPGARRALALAGGSGLTYGRGPSNDAVLSVDPASASWGASGTLTLGSGERIHISLVVPGAHNLMDAAAAILAAGHAGVTPGQAAAALNDFSGVRRRLEFRGAARGARFVDDYAHHPTEVVATLEAARGRGRLLAIFQPHRYTRTRAFWRSMGESLAGADVVVVTDVYPAGEAPIPGVSGKLLVEALAEALPRKRIAYLPRRAEVVRFLASEVREGDLVLTLGAGDITMVAEETLERIRESE